MEDHTDETSQIAVYFVTLAVIRLKNEVKTEARRHWLTIWEPQLYFSVSR